MRYHIQQLRMKLEEFEESLQEEDFSPLTINSYSSATRRFLDYLEEGRIRHK